MPHSSIREQCRLCEGLFPAVEPYLAARNDARVRHVDDIKLAATRNCQDPFLPGHFVLSLSSAWAPSYLIGLEGVIQSDLH